MFSTKFLFSPGGVSDVSGTPVGPTPWRQEYCLCPFDGETRRAWDSYRHWDVSGTVRLLVVESLHRLESPTPVDPRRRGHLLTHTGRVRVGWTGRTPPLSGSPTLGVGSRVVGPNQSSPSWTSGPGGPPSGGEVEGSSGKSSPTPWVPCQE